MEYIFALDLSISNSGIAIFNKNASLEKIQSIKTNPSDSHGIRLKQIADKLIELRLGYPPQTVIIERGFSLHNIATQVLYRVHGIANYVFYDCEQIYYAPTSIKKAITGDGKADKKLVQKMIKEIYQDIKFKDFDQSDAVAIGLTYFIKDGVLNYEIR